MKEPHRRNFLRKILTLTASAGVAGLLLDRLPARSLVQPVQAQPGTALVVDGNAGTGVGTTQLASSGNPAFLSTNTSTGSALQGTCTSGTGVLGTTTTGTGVQGTAGAGGTGVNGFAGDPTAIPIVAQGDTGQTAPLQEWRGSSGTLDVVDSNGNFGIGTSSPTNLLHLYSTTDSVYRQVGDGTASAFSFEEYYPGVGGPGIYIKSARGSFATPASLQVGDRMGQVILAGYNGTAFANVAGIEGWIDAGTVSSTSLPSYLAFRTTPNGSISRLERMRINSAGYVGIGTTSPAYPLDVAGQVHATGFPTSSDMRFKEDIQPIDNALDKVLQLQGVYFKWNHLHRETLKRSSTLTSRQVGLIAQQVKEVLPEVVSEWADQGAEDYLAVDYSRLAAVTIEAIKELKSENNTLRDRIGTLERKLAAS